MESYIPTNLLDDSLDLPKYVYNACIKLLSDILISKKNEELINFLQQLIMDLEPASYTLETDESRIIIQHNFTGPPYCFVGDNTVKSVYILQDGIILSSSNLNYKIRISSYNETEYDIIKLYDNKFIDTTSFMSSNFYNEYTPKRVKYESLWEEIMILIK